jgi:hypothetical protein
MVGAAKAHQMRATGMVAGKPHRLHDGFGSRHVERYFIQAGDLLQTCGIVGYDRVICPEDGPQLTDVFVSLFDARLVKIIPEDVNPIRSAQIVEAVAVQIRQRYAFG